MVKIIEGPKRTPGVFEWYHHIIINCYRCGTRFQLEPGDPIINVDSKLAADDGRDNRTERWFVQCYCPNCKNSIFRYGPLRTRGIGNYYGKPGSKRRKRHERAMES